MSETEKKKKLAIIASKGSLDMAYPPLILATTALAMDWDVGVFFTFYGLDIINKKKIKKLKVGPVGNPAMPKIGNVMQVPNILGMLPGSTALATRIMKKWMSDANVAKLPELLDNAVEFGATLFGCQMTMDVMGVKREDLIEEASVCGAAGFLDYAKDADVTLFV